ncbi:MAG: carbamoyltransferase [Planctomycetes bacterium]|nr:carbamoyltransferase [Planctomycetota bacterium]
MTQILGISCYYHDSAACLYRDGRPVAAVSEERFTRKKHDDSFPTRAIEYCLAAGGIEAKDLDCIGFYDKPIRKFERILATTISTFPRGLRAFWRAIPVWLHEKLWVPRRIVKKLGYPKTKPILFTDHHESHAASAFLVSPFEEAAIISIDGVGEWATATYGVGRGTDIEIQAEMRFPHSLGLFYSAFTYYCGFKINSGEYKLMGLAPYGEPKYVDRILEHLLDLKEDGSFQLHMDYFTYQYGTTTIGPRFERLFGAKSRKPGEPLTQFHMDVAASAQKVTEEAILGMARHVHEKTGLTRLCMAGGVALNCVANGRIIRETPFKDLFVQPAAGDAGGALGVAAFIYHSLLKNPREYVMNDAYLGPAYSTEQAETYLKRIGVPYRKLDRPELLSTCARLIAEGNVVGWFQGRMEFGPRALGSRSILADPRQPTMKDLVNEKIKLREGFRPFAPTVTSERANDWFELDVPSPFMLLCAPVREGRTSLPAITHVDRSARIQTVSGEQNALYHDLIEEFERQTGCAVILNTSFNIRGEPIVLDPEQAFRCFMRTDMDHLLVDSFHLDKKEMPPAQQVIGAFEEFPLD